MIWFGTRSLSISYQGGGDGANSNHSKTSSSLLVLYQWFLQYGFFWETRSLSISSQGGGDGANSNDSKTSYFLAYSYSQNILEYGMVWYMVS
jgi:hypothetical protein